MRSFCTIHYFVRLCVCVCSPLFCLFLTKQINAIFCNDFCFDTLKMSMFSSSSSCFSLCPYKINNSSPKFCEIFKYESLLIGFFLFLICKLKWINSQWIRGKYWNKIKKQEEKKKSLWISEKSHNQLTMVTERKERTLNVLELNYVMEDVSDEMIFDQYQYNST